MHFLFTCFSLENYTQFPEAEQNLEDIQITKILIRGKQETVCCFVNNELKDWQNVQFIYSRTEFLF